MLSLLLWGGLAWADAGDEAQEEAPAGDESLTSAGITQEELHALEAASFYKIGLELVARGSFAEAQAIFQQVVSRYPETPVAAGATEQIAALESLAGAGGTKAPRGGLDGVTELVINQAIAMPLVMGLLLPGATFQPGEPLVPVVMGMAGMGVGIGGALVLDKYRPVDTAFAMSLFSGEWLGALNGLTVSAKWPPRGYRGLWAEMLAGTVVGAGAAVAADQYWDVSPGQVSALNSGAVWGAYLGFMSQIFGSSDSSADVLVRTTLFVDGGAALGAYLGTQFEPSRGRVNMITLSGLAGTAMAGGATVLLNYYGNLYEAEPTAALLMGGSAAGLGLGTFLTRNYDENRGGVALASLQMAPLVSTDGLVGMRAGGSW